MLRKLIAVICLAAFVVSLSACGLFSSTQTAEEISKPDKKAPAAKNLADTKPEPAKVN